MSRAAQQPALDTDGPELAHPQSGGLNTVRALLFTVLGEFVLPAGGTAWTAQFLDVLTRLGVEPKSARQALMRMSGDGWLTPERVGRRTRWQLSGPARQVLTDGAARIREFTTIQDDWDGEWLLVLVRIPESDRPARHLVRSRLSTIGFGTASPGTWVSTHLDRRPDAEQVLADAGVLPDAVILEGRVVAGQQPAELAARAWDLDALQADYRQFADEFRDAEAADPLARIVELVHAWRRFPWTDPTLPVQLLAPDWNGVAAADLFRARRARWTDQAQTAWSELL